MEENNSSATTTTSNSPMSESEEGELRSQVFAVKPLLQNICSYLKQTLVTVQHLEREDASPTSHVHFIHVHYRLVTAQTTVGIASQELVTNDDVPINVPRIKCDDTGDVHFTLVTEQDNGLIVAIEREDVPMTERERVMTQIPPGRGAVNEEEVLQGMAQRTVARMDLRRHYVRYGVGAGTDGGDLKPRFQLPVMPFDRYQRFCVWGPYVYIACGNYVAFIDFSGDEPNADFISGLRQVESEKCDDIFRHEQAIVVHGHGVRTVPLNTSIEEVSSMFEYVEIFALAKGDGRPTHQDRFYLPQRPHSAQASSLTQLVGPDKDQLLLVTTDFDDGSSQIRLVPTVPLRDEQHAVAVAEAAPSLLLAIAPITFVVRNLENGNGQELLMSAQFQGLLSVPLDDDFGDTVVPTTLFQPEHGESVRDVQLLDNVPWILVWNSTTNSERVIKLGPDGTVLKSVPLAGDGGRQFL